MDTAAFVIALIAFLAVGYWYCKNEAKSAGGGIGLFALRLFGAAAADPSEAGPETEAAGEGPRYRTRTRVAPVRSDRLRTAPDVETYRGKDVKAPSYKKRARYGDAPLEDL
jgi:hypothetical protein